MEYEVLNYVPEIPDILRNNTKWAGIVDEFNRDKENKTLIFSFKNKEDYKRAYNSLRSLINKRMYPITVYARMTNFKIYLIKA